MIEVRGLTKRFGSREVLKGVDLVVPRGTTTVVLGGSGSGKTVLMKHLIGLIQPTSGEVLIDGESLGALDESGLARVRRKFGMVFQNAALFDSMTVAENVAFPLREQHPELKEDEVAQRVAEKLALFALQGTEARFPDELSGGMRKRVGLARAIVLGPQVVLYDEPTTGLDPITTEQVDQMILAAKRELGVTSVVISHDIASAFHVADQIAFLYEGRIVAVGPPRALREHKHPRVHEFLATWFGKNEEQSQGVSAGSGE